MNGSVDILCFADSYQRLAEKLKLTVPVLVKGGVRVEEGSNPKLMIDDITPLEEAKPKLPQNLRIKIPLETVSAATIDELHIAVRRSAKATRACSSIWSAKATSPW